MIDLKIFNVKQFLTEPQMEMVEVCDSCMETYKLVDMYVFEIKKENDETHRGYMYCSPACVQIGLIIELTTT